MKILSNSLSLVGLDDLVAIVEGYRQRKYNEDMMEMDRMGGKYH